MSRMVNMSIFTASSEFEGVIARYKQDREPGILCFVNKARFLLLSTYVFQSNVAFCC